MFGLALTSVLKQVQHQKQQIVIVDSTTTYSCRELNGYLSSQMSIQTRYKMTEFLTLGAHEYNVQADLYGLGSVVNYVTHKHKPENLFDTC